MTEKILKPYVVTIEYTAVVMAESEIEAYKVAHRYDSEIMSDGEPDISIGHEIASLKELKSHGWSGEDVPYGGDGETELGEIFESLAALPTPDTKTIDMFAEADQTSVA